MAGLEHMNILKRFFLSIVTLFAFALPIAAQATDPLVFATVHRPPFADTEGDEITGLALI